MKKYILMLLFISVTNYVIHAQDESNNATWNETISFLNKYKNYIKTGEYFDCILKERENMDINYISITENTFKIKVKVDTRYDYKEFTVPLSKINSFSSGRLYTTGKDIDYKYQLTCDWNLSGKVSTQNGSKANSRSSINFYVRDSEMRPRIYKAFKHLVYLAKKKREEARKNSGEKF